MPMRRRVMEVAHRIRAFFRKRMLRLMGYSSRPLWPERVYEAERRIYAGLLLGDAPRRYDGKPAVYRVKDPPILRGEGLDRVCVYRTFC